MGNTLPREHNLDRHPQGTKPRVFSVPSNVHQILSPLSTSPEGEVMNALMSDEASNNIVALFGMGGVGKTTILRALGNDTRIWAKFPDGVWFFQLGDNIQLPTFIKHLHAFVKSMFPDFADDFKELAADKNMHGTMVIQLIDRLISQRVLLIFDDVCNVNEDVYNLVCELRIARQTAAGACTMLMSTRNWDIADFGTHVLPIPIYPKHIVTDINRNILYRNANITTSELASISPQNRIALDCIIKMCAGLPLALRAVPRKNFAREICMHVHETME